MSLGPPGAHGGGSLASPSASAKAARPLSRVEQMLHAYYDLEETSEGNASDSKELSLVPDQETNEQQNDNTTTSCIQKERETETQETGGGGGALKTTLQLLQELPCLQHSMAAAVRGGRGQGAPPPPPQLDLNSPEFNMQTFFSAAVRSCSLRDLLRLSNALDGEVRLLEREIQTLVYENYGKFLSATETVRRVRHAMGDVEQQLQCLSTSVASIEESSGHLMGTVHERVAGIEDLVAFRQLIEQLQLLSTMPELLRRHLLAGDPETALRVYEHARIFLAEQQGPCPHLQRLALLRKDADTAAAYARKLLRHRLGPPVAEASATPQRNLTLGKSDQEAAAGTNGGLIRNDSGVYVHPEKPLSSTDASRILRLLLRTGEEPVELLRLYQRGRRQASSAVLEDCFSRETANKTIPTPTASPSDEVCAGGSAGQERNDEATELTLELACSRLSVHYVDVFAVALQDTLFTFRFLAALKLQQNNSTGGSAETSEVRRIRNAFALAEAGQIAIDAEGEAALLSLVSAFIEAAFCRLSAVIASAVPIAASVVRGTSSVVSAAERKLGEFLPPPLQLRATRAVRTAQQTLLLEATALAFKRAYAKVVQELHDAIAATVQQQQQQRQQQQQQDEGSMGSFMWDRFHGLSPSVAAALAVEISRQHPAEHSLVAEGCVALTDAQQLLQGAASPAAAEDHLLVKRHTAPWVAGLFELFVRLAARLTKNIPAAFAGYPEVLEDALRGVSVHRRQTQKTNTNEPWLISQVEAAVTSALGCLYTSPEETSDEQELPPHALPLVALVFLRIGRSLQQMGLAKLEAIGRELFPSLAAGWLGGRSSTLGVCTAGPASPAALRDAGDLQGLPVASRLRAASQGLLTAYVFCLGQAAAEASVLSLAKHNQMQQDAAAAAAAGACNEQQTAAPSPPAGTSSSLAPLLGALRQCDSELLILMDEGNASAAAAAQLVKGTEKLLAAQPQRRLGRPLGRRRAQIEREMERLFARKQRVFFPIPFSRTKAVIGVFRIAARGLLEFVRGYIFSVRTLQQLQVDCAAASCAIRELVQPEDASVVDGFFDEIVASAALRSIDKSFKRAGNALDTNNLILQDREVDAILNAERANPPTAPKHRV